MGALNNAARKTGLNAAFLAVATLALGGCGDFVPIEAVDAGDPDVFDAVRIDIDDGTGVRRDLVVEGARFELILEEEPGTFRSDLEFRAVDLEVEGTFRFDDGQIVFSDGPFEDDDLVLERSYDVLLGRDVLLIEGATGVFDVDNDGDTEVVDLDVRLERRR